MKNRAEELQKEQSLIHGTENCYGIYQLSDGRGSEYRFMGLDFVESRGLQIKGSDYQFVYGNRLSENETLDTLFYQFNVEHPKDFYGHSLSVSDVIVLRRDGTIAAYYVNDVGFRQLPEFILEREDYIQKKFVSSILRYSI